MRFYFRSKQANHVEIRKNYVANQDSTFFFFLPAFGMNTKHFEQKHNKRYSSMTTYSVHWLAWKFVRRTFRKRTKAKVTIKTMK